MSTAESCCQIPPIVAKGYEPKGKYTEVNGMKSCSSLPTLSLTLSYLQLLIDLSQQT